MSFLTLFEMPGDFDPRDLDTRDRDDGIHDREDEWLVLGRGGSGSAALRDDSLDDDTCDRNEHRRPQPVSAESDQAHPQIVVRLVAVCLGRKRERVINQRISAGERGRIAPIWSPGSTAESIRETTAVAQTDWEMGADADLVRPSRCRTHDDGRDAEPGRAHLVTGSPGEKSRTWMISSGKIVWFANT